MCPMWKCKWHFEPFDTLSLSNAHIKYYNVLNLTALRSFSQTTKERNKLKTKWTQRFCDTMPQIQ